MREWELRELIEHYKSALIGFNSALSALELDPYAKDTELQSQWLRELAARTELALADTSARHTELQDFALRIEQPEDEEEFEDD